MNTLTKSILDYNERANTMVIHHFIDNHYENNKALLLMSHILNANEIWLARLQNRTRFYGLFEEHSIENQEAIHLNTCKELRHFFLDQEEETLLKPITYQTTEGYSMRSKPMDILWHIVNHGSYHRGQIAQLMRKDDIDPPETDYIFFSREEA